MSADHRRNCYRCQFYYVTWDNQHPNGCRALNFKARQLPSMVVFQSSGKPCEYFKEKSAKKPAQS